MRDEGSGVEPDILEQITALEDQIASHGNATRQVMLDQGNLIIKAVSGGLALKEIAERTGVSVSNARVRKSVASKMASSIGQEVQALLDAHEQVYVSFDALNSVLSDSDPVQILAELLFEAEATGKVSRDKVRAKRGNVPGTVGTVDATIARMLADPKYAAEMAEELAKTVDGRLLLERLMSIMQKRRSRTPAEIREGHADEITTAVFNDGRSTTRLFESVQELAPVSDEYRETLLAHIGEQRQRYTLIETLLNSGAVDQELAVLLGGGE
jgi:hypothetical protein